MNMIKTNETIVRVLLCLALTRLPVPAANAIYDALVEQGLEVSPQETIKLPQPALDDGLEHAQQQSAIEPLLAGKYDWETFTRKSVVSPLLLKITDEGRDSGRVGRRVDLYFVAYGSLTSVGGDNYLQNQLNLTAAGDQGEKGGRAKVLSADELSKRGLPASQKPHDPRWVAVDSTLLSKVRISLTTQNLKTESDDSILIASIVDRRFDKDAEYPNCWRSISTDDAGRRQIGPPQPYSGLGSYVKATRLAQPAGAIFMEYHVAFAEPQGWFHGANLLRSKLPIVAQDMVRKFRRSMSDDSSIPAKGFGNRQPTAAICGIRVLRRVRSPPQRKSLADRPQRDIALN